MTVALVLYNITHMLRYMLPLPMLLAYFPIFKVFPLIFLAILYNIIMYYYFPNFSILFQRIQVFNNSRLWNSFMWGDNITSLPLLYCLTWYWKRNFFLCFLLTLCSLNIMPQWSPLVKTSEWMLQDEDGTAELKVQVGLASNIPTLWT